METYKIADKKIMDGYEYGARNESIRACDEWLSAWEDIKSIMAEDGINSLEKLQETYPWTDFLTNYVQELEAELHNAGIKNEAYYRKRILYCQELLERCGGTNDLMVENTRRAIADSHFALGEEQEGESLYQRWLLEDPEWGWGYIGWSDCYHFAKKRTSAQLEKAEEILTKALNRAALRDRRYVLERAVELSKNMGNMAKAEELQEELSRLIRVEKESWDRPKQPLVKAKKIGRNDPCPCGSGKKYKKCCGR